jgi:hypothetical protein
MSARRPEFIAVDGIAGPAIVTAARAALTSLDRARRSGISHWDASGLFQDLAVAGSSAGQPSMRTLLLLYAADLAFRLRWEIRPALTEGRSVVAAPYIDTAIAFGRAAGIDGAWLTNLFLFAPRPTVRKFVGGVGARGGRSGGFVEFSFAQVNEDALGATRAEFVERMTAHLRATAKRYRSPADRI